MRSSKQKKYMLIQIKYSFLFFFFFIILNIHSNSRNALVQKKKINENEMNSTTLENDYHMTAILIIPF